MRRMKCVVSCLTASYFEAGKTAGRQDGIRVCLYRLHCWQIPHAFSHVGINGPPARRRSVSEMHTSDNSLRDIANVSETGGSYTAYEPHSEYVAGKDADCLELNRRSTCYTVIYCSLCRVLTIPYVKHTCF